MPDHPSIPASASNPTEQYLYTTLGLIGRNALGMILPHEHIFVDFRTPDQPGYAEANPADVVAAIAPEIRGDQGARHHGIRGMHAHRGRSTG